MVETPIRKGSRQRKPSSNNNPGINVPPSSPAHMSLPATSPGVSANSNNNRSEVDMSSPLNYGTPSSLGSIRTPRSGIRGTPLKPRADIQMDKRMRQVAVIAEVNLISLPEFPPPPPLITLIIIMFFWLFIY